MVERDEWGRPLPPPHGVRVGEISATPSHRTEDGSMGTASLRRHLAEADAAFRSRHNGRVGLDPVTPSLVGSVMEIDNTPAQRGTSSLRGVDPPSTFSREPLRRGMVTSVVDDRVSVGEPYYIVGSTSQSWSQSTVDDLDAEESGEHGTSSSIGEDPEEFADYVPGVSATAVPRPQWEDRYFRYRSGEDSLSPEPDPSLRGPPVEVTIGHRLVLFYPSLEGFDHPYLRGYEGSDRSLEGQGGFYYGVRLGWERGIFRTWGGCWSRIADFRRHSGTAPLYRRFAEYREAVAYIGWNPRHEPDPVPVTFSLPPRSFEIPGYQLGPDPATRAVYRSRPGSVPGSPYRAVPVSSHALVPQRSFRSPRSTTRSGRGSSYGPASQTAFAAYFRPPPTPVPVASASLLPRGGVPGSTASQDTAPTEASVESEL